MAGDDRMQEGDRMDLGLKGKNAIITGGSVGIGLAVAEALAAEGVNLLLCARNEERLTGEAKRIAAEFGVTAVGVRADVTQSSDVDTVAAAASEAFGKVDILINNAGSGTSETVMDSEDEAWQHSWDLHVMAAIRFTRSIVPLMRKAGGGVILNTSSICAKQPLWYEPIYNVTKAALSMFGKCLANELIPEGIRVNTIAPGLILTPDWRKTAGIHTEGTSQTVDGYLEGIAKENTPIGRFATPEELANFYVFLCSERASYCVGSTYYVDGGWLKTVE
jgi:NAD(P)-dependent dehydrogenase (short-subunit alcohol dehydrogenase family)